MVIDPSIKRLFCEGVPGGLDEKLFDHILPHGADTYVHPLGGKHGMNSYIDGYLALYPQDNAPDYVGIRDRDFDKRPDEYPQNQLIPASDRKNAKPIWLTYRASIENYLISPELVHQYLHERSVASSHASHLPDLAAIAQIIHEAAKALADYQTIRWGLASLKQSERWPEINTSWTGSSGKLPGSLEFDVCLSEAKGLIQQFCGAVEQIDETKFLGGIQEFHDIFDVPDFFDTGQYAYWFHGKDLSAMLFRKLGEYLQENKLPHNISRKRFEEWACRNMDIANYPDLEQLREQLASTSSSLTTS